MYDIYDVLPTDPDSGSGQICFQWNTIAALVNLIHDADALTRLRSY